MENNKNILCGANAYEKKYYFNEEFSSLPETVKEELRIMCVLFTEDVGGIIMLEFDEELNLNFEIQADEGDLLFDEIGADLKIKKIREEKRDLFEALEMYYRIWREQKCF